MNGHVGVIFGEKLWNEWRVESMEKSIHSRRRDKAINWVRYLLLPDISFPFISPAPNISSLVSKLPWENLAEIGDGDGAPGGEFLSVALDPLQLVESGCCQVAFSTVRTDDHRYLLNYEQVAATPITPRYAPLPGSLFTANLADHRIPTVMASFYRQ
jgi:hypothetical protein